MRSCAISGCHRKTPSSKIANNESLTRFAPVELRNRLLKRCETHALEDVKLFEAEHPELSRCTVASCYSFLEKDKPVVLKGRVVTNCDFCREKRRIKESNQYNKQKEKNQAALAARKDVNCRTCRVVIPFDDLYRDHCQNIVLTCASCRAIQHEVNVNRDRDVVNAADRRRFREDPAYAARKKAWKAANREKVTGIWRKSRGRHFETEDRYQAYLKRCREQHVIWVQNNRAKVFAYDAKRVMFQPRVDDTGTEHRETTQEEFEQFWELSKPATCWYAV